MKKAVMLVAAVLALALTACGRQEDTGKVVYIPLWMEPYSVVYYDADLNRTIAEGGDLTEEEINSREDIRAVGMYGDELAEPDTKVEYDLHGFIQNVYYAAEKPPTGGFSAYKTEPLRTSYHGKGGAEHDR